MNKEVEVEIINDFTASVFSAIDKIKIIVEDLKEEACIDMGKIECEKNKKQIVDVYDTFKKLYNSIA
jgi:hypothetical protein